MFIKKNLSLSPKGNSKNLTKSKTNFLNLTNENFKKNTSLEIKENFINKSELSQINKSNFIVSKKIRNLVKSKNYIPLYKNPDVIYWSVIPSKNIQTINSNSRSIKNNLWRTNKTQEKNFSPVYYEVK